MPVTADGYTATGSMVGFTLNFAPETGAQLMLVKNTGPEFIDGAFDNLAQGQAVALSYGGVTYRFVANYFRLYLHAVAMNLLVRLRRWTYTGLKVFVLLLGLLYLATRVGPGYRLLVGVALDQANGALAGDITVDEVRSGGLLGGAHLAGVRFVDPRGRPFVENLADLPGAIACADSCCPWPPSCCSSPPPPGPTSPRAPPPGRSRGR